MRWFTFGLTGPHNPEGLTESPAECVKTSYILMKASGKVDDGTRRRWLNVGDDPGFHGGLVPLRGSLGLRMGLNLKSRISLFCQCV